MRILSVEDEESTAALVKMLLKRELGSSVDIAPDCASARVLFSENSYDLVTLDYQLPDGDGLTLLDEILRMEGAPPVIMVTGHGDESTAVSAFKLGASGYVVKDARMSTMLIEEARSALARAGQAKSEGELGCALEELRVSAEELRVRNDELVSSGRMLEGVSARYRDLFESAPDGYVVSDAKGIIEDANLAAMSMLGCNSESIRGKPMNVFLAPGCSEVFFANLGRVVARERETVSFETSVKPIGGNPFPVSVTAVSDRYFEAGRPGIRWILRDDTDRKAAEAEVRSNRDHLEELVEERTSELKRSNAELQQFAYVASHDLQEPLRMVASYVQLLEKRYQDKLDDDANEFIGYAVDGVNRMQTLINDLLLYSRLEAGAKPLMPTDATSALGQGCANLRAAIEESGAVVGNDPLPTVMAGETQLAQVFQNLIGNAVKFRSEEPPRIHVSAGREGDGWVFSVVDNGIGFDPQYSERIFNIFQRLHGRDEYSGTGIGLSLCKRIVERNGGRIWAESEPGKGSTFYFTIPERQVRGNDSEQAD